MMPFALTASFLPLQFAETYVPYTSWFPPEGYRGLFSCWENTTAPPSVRQQTLAGIFATSQATISRAAGSILSVLDVMLPPPERYFPSN